MSNLINGVTIQGQEQQIPLTLTAFNQNVTYSVFLTMTMKLDDVDLHTKI